MSIVLTNYRRAFQNQFKVKDPLQFGLMGACCLD